MISVFQDYIDREKLINKPDQVLIGVSGGIDSMVMGDLFYRVGIPHGIAHCNFLLRGEESEADETFVKEYAEKKGLVVFTKRFQTESFAKQMGISVQMAARELRRAWFSELLKNTKFTLCATAHHMDDQNETFFINLLRGCGISGLHGILPKQEKTIHPMLFARRRDIEAHARKFRVPFREDSTNKQTHYQRNKIRHKIIPVMQEMNPDFPASLNNTIKRIRSIETIYRNHLLNVWKNVSDSSTETVRIDGIKILKLPEKNTYLFEFLQPYGFSSSDVDLILGILPKGQGQEFHSKTHRLIIDRQNLLVVEKKTESKSSAGSYLIQKNDRRIFHPLSLELVLKERTPKFQIDASENRVQLNAELINYPLRIRKWQKGDRFIPLGMKGKKLVSDYFIDEKFSPLEKEQCWLLTSDENVIWIIGYRIDDRYKVTPKTRLILEIKLNNQL